MVDKFQIIENNQNDKTRIKELEALNNTLSQELEDWSSTFNSLTDMVTIHDKEYNIIRANTGAREMLKLPLSNIFTKVKCFMCYHGTEKPPEGCPSCKSLETEIPCISEIFEPHLNRYLEIRAIPRFDSNHKCIGLVHVVRDISEKKKIELELKQLNEELETRVRQRTIELENSNKALESFSYSVSHDLRSPLRVINGFSQILLNDYQELLGNEGSHLLQMIRDNTLNMDLLITGLLDLAKTSNQEMNMRPIDMNQMVRFVYEEVVSEEDRSKISFTADHLPEMIGDPTLIHQVWTNLILNAVKFSRIKENPAIHIQSYVEKNQIVYSIKDNGVGFNPEYKHKLFSVFQRLHPRQDFEGSGIGLALVKRIVQRHGGEVWAEGKEREGAMFHFSLPVK